MGEVIYLRKEMTFGDILAEDVKHFMQGGEVAGEFSINPDRVYWFGGKILIGDGPFPWEDDPFDEEIKP